MQGFILMSVMVEFEQDGLSGAISVLSSRMHPHIVKRTGVDRFLRNGFGYAFYNVLLKFLLEFVSVRPFQPGCMCSA